MPVVAGNRSSKWDACRAKATRLEYCLRDNNYRPVDCAPEILDLKECCQLHEWKSIHCGYVPDQEPAPLPQRKLVIEPQIDPIKAEKMFTEFVEQLVKRGHSHSPTREEHNTAVDTAAKAAAADHVPVERSSSSSGSEGEH